jgi:hypothetical protein
VVNNNLNIQLPNSKIGKLSPEKYDITYFALQLLNLIVPLKITIDKSLIKLYKEKLSFPLYILSLEYKLLSHCLRFLSKVSHSYFSKLIAYIVTFLRYEIQLLKTNSTLIIIPKQSSY